MARWLVKTEPDEYSFADLQGAGKDVWDGVKNYLARVASMPYPDPNEGDSRWIVVDIEALIPLARSVTLAEVKADPAFSEWELVRISRLSVMPVPHALWDRIVTMSQLT